ncbi:MAG: hypothetical protein DRJ56_04520 [Thermoprotei archaeon]|nr:MAG: hypothetical protein DRJ56_04520 [Thermoprotei archaeon]
MSRTSLAEELERLTRVEMRVLVFLRYSGPCFTIKLRRHGFSPGTLSKLLARLERRGLVEVVRNPLTGKWVVVALTDRGRRLAELLLYLSERVKVS